MRCLPMNEDPYFLVERVLARPACLRVCRGILASHTQISELQESPSSRHLPCTHINCSDNVQAIKARAV